MSEQNKYKISLVYYCNQYYRTKLQQRYTFRHCHYISHDFSISNSLTQLSIAVFYLVWQCGNIFGYISDYFGRRKILILSTSISSVGTLMCVVAPNIYILIIGRLIQGLALVVLAV